MNIAAHPLLNIHDSRCLIILSRWWVKINIEYALRGDFLTHISEVEQGLKCDCVCPGCFEKMIARKGSKIAHHYAHQNAECSHGLETTLHLMAKTILEQEKKILLPKVEMDFGYKTFEIISKSTMIEFDEVFLEKHFDEIVPDILIKAGEKLLVIEIWVSHKVDDIKCKKIKRSEISTLEIDLSNLDRMINLEDLRKVLLEETANKKWIYNRLSEYYKQRWLSVCEVKEIISRNLALHVDYCPINARIWRGKPYANVIDDCSGCEFMIQATPHHDPSKNDEFDNNKLLYCSGKANVRSVSDLKEHFKK